MRKYRHFDFLMCSSGDASKLGEEFPILVAERDSGSITGV
jgi:hypothetical protein